MAAVGTRPTCWRLISLNARAGQSGKLRFLFDVFRRLVMSSKHNPTSRVLAVFALASSSLTSVAEAQPYAPGQGGSGNMMGGGWGWGMGGFGGVGILVVALVVLAIA